ncbi:MAG: response regulator [Kiritimatiellae bacterium]|nr:response regulator [Kiritimatiellia bacterium]
MARILLVDDEDTILNTLGTLLRSELHEVLTAREGQEAYDLIWSTQDIELLITDIRMSPVDGMELMRLSKEVRPQMPIVVVSAYLDDKTIRQVEDLGCAGYIRKPFTVKEALQVIRKALGEES